jgi:hypothetical protein
MARPGALQEWYSNGVDTSDLSEIRQMLGEGGVIALMDLVPEIPFTLEALMPLLRSHDPDEQILVQG